MPSQAYVTLPVFRNWFMTVTAVLVGTANPRPWLPPDCEAICSLMPVTRPDASMSGPPELPSLMAASVWMPLEMIDVLGDCRLRLVAETMPAVSEKS
jgi:hypothetical protein